LLHRRSANLNTGWHAHSKAQLLYAEDGITRLYTPKGSYLLPARHCAWIPAHMVHMVTSSSPCLFLRTLYFKIAPEQAHPFYTQCSVFQVNNLLREMILYTERWAHATSSTLEETSFLTTLKLILPDLQGASLSLQLPTSEHPKIKECLQIIMEGMSEKISVEATAQKLNLSTRTLSRLFQQELKMSFTGFLKVARIIKALEWLSLLGATVAETAFKVGYDSVPTFSNNFYEIVGSRPQTFIQKQQ
ncbi:MAG TPA: helix-turn-helix transcriptional regulator, partial [Flavisolibacter sp.]|nr:helix-turn-helix transcriptional regulator [Flavisolibacter sp.]